LDGFYLIVYEVGPAKDRYGNTIGYDVHPVLRKWYLTLKEGLSVAETVFDSNMKCGFREIVASIGVES
jgi:hypothetical protein